MPSEESQRRDNRRGTGFAGDVLKLASGTAFAQAVSILAAPVLSRLYAPEAFGIAALFLSITGILGVVACMRYEMAIMLPRRDEEAAGLLGVSLASAAAVTLAAVFLLWWGGAFLLRRLNAPGLGPYLWLVPPAVLVAGVFLALNYWDTRAKRFGRLSAARVAGSLTSTPLTVALGVAGRATAGSMIGANIAGQCVATGILGWRAWREDRALFRGHIRWRSMAEGMKRYRKFPLYDSWASLMNAVSGQLAPLLLAVFFSSTVVGFYALGYRLLTLPSTLIGGAISQVFFRHAAAARNDGTLPRVVGGTFNRLLALGLFPIMLIMVAGKEIMAVVFGSPWAEAGVYAQILAPWILMNFVSSPLSSIFPIMEIQGRFLVFNAVLLATRVFSLAAGGIMGDVVVSLALFSITGALIYGFLCLFILGRSGVGIGTVLSDTLRLVGLASIPLSPVVFLKLFGASPVAVTAACCATAVAYYAMLGFRDREFRLLLGSLAGRG